MQSPFDLTSDGYALTNAEHGVAARVDLPDDEFQGWCERHKIENDPAARDLYRTDYSLDKITVPEGYVPLMHRSHEFEEQVSATEVDKFTESKYTRMSNEEVLEYAARSLTRAQPNRLPIREVLRRFEELTKKKEDDSNGE